MRDRPFWDVTVPRLLSSYAVLMFVLLWVGFAVALVADRAWLDTLWYGVQALPPVVKVLVWLVLLPVMVGLWIRESSWPAFVRLLSWGGMAIWTLSAVASFVKAFR